MAGAGSYVLCGPRSLTARQPPHQQHRPVSFVAILSNWLFFRCNTLQLAFLSLQYSPTGSSFVAILSNWLFFRCNTLQLAFLSLQYCPTGFSFVAILSNWLFFRCNTVQLAPSTAVKNKITKAVSTDDQLLRTTAAKDCPTHYVRVQLHFPGPHSWAFGLVVPLALLPFQQLWFMDSLSSLRP